MAPARVSESAKAKADTKLTSDRLPVHSFTTVLADLTTLTLNEAMVPSNPTTIFPCLRSHGRCGAGPSNFWRLIPPNSSRGQTRRGCYMSSPT